MRCVWYAGRCRRCGVRECCVPVGVPAAELASLSCTAQTCSDLPGPRTDSSAQRGSGSGSLARISMPPQFRRRDLIETLLSWEARPVDGKGNGGIAVEHIKAGTCLLSERPWVEWSREDYEPWTAVAEILARADAGQDTWVDLDHLYPGNVASLPPTRQYEWRDMQIPTSVLQSFPSASRDEIARLRLILDCNAFPSGLVINLAYLNHSCTPNCQVLEYSTARGPEYSLFALCDIGAGQELTISYLDLALTAQLSQARQRKLEQQYFFSCQCRRCTDLEDESLACLQCDGGVDWETGKCSGCQAALGRSKLAKTVSKLDDLLEELESLAADAVLACPILQPDGSYRIESECAQPDELLATVAALSQRLRTIQSKAKPIVHPGHFILKLVQAWERDLARAGSDLCGAPGETERLVRSL
ncbi:uncharacterized protein BJ171DRAFT_518553 [Polychytrium aggregatum]|uniref:uncharacterized protein n=1 Tax=Polychytrium aggregatum TaxID=110093 RepID=UPI0022FF21D5|nr:uncharacterized protein BJ171DRAFT_518553 [Polychytrium aggregatum]KAI9199492.1 hypothetical protein BJ171DRAFT_518553 [Polychytrium aggregatum]